MPADRANASALDGAQDALNRMSRASKRGTGCYLTPEMIASLAISAIGQIWMEEDDPRAQARETSDAR